MDKNIFFIAGIHGVGKSTFCSQLSNELGIKHYSASSLIKKVLSQAVNSDKRVSNVQKNQDILIQAINLLVKEDTFLLDGHFCLINKKEEIEPIPVETFEKLKPKAVLLIHDDINKVLQRLERRDSFNHCDEIFKQLNNAETMHSHNVCKLLNIPFFKQKTGTTTQEFIEKIKTTRK